MRLCCQRRAQFSCGAAAEPGCRCRGQETAADQSKCSHRFLHTICKTATLNPCAPNLSLLSTTLAMKTSTSRSLLQVKAAESEMAAWDGFRASLRHLQPALVLPFPPSLNSDVSPLPPPPPPCVEGDGGVSPEEPDTDSPMM